MTTQTRFTSIDQCLIFVLGQLEGLAGTTRHELSPEVRHELMGIATTLKEQLLLHPER